MRDESINRFTSPVKPEKVVSPRSLLGLLMLLITERDKLNNRIAGIEKRLRDEAGYNGATTWRGAHKALSSGWNARPLPRSRND